MQGARNGSGGESERVHVLAHFLEAFFVGDAEALLLVHDEQAEILELYVLRKEAVGADDNVDLAGFEVGENFLLFGGAAEAAEHFDAHGKCGEALFEGFEMLESENGGGSKNGDLFAVGDGFEGRAHGDFGFAVADVAAQEPIHRRRGAPYRA